MINNKKKKIKTIAALIIFFTALMGLIAYFLIIQVQDNKIKELSKFDLLELYAQNNDLVGWLQIEGTDINYPVMNGDEYLRKNFRKEDSRSGTPFVADGYTFSNPNILIYGHNMEYDKTMFYDLTKYKDKKFAEEHREATYYAICDNEKGKKYIDERKFEIFSTIITDISQWHYWEYAFKNSDLDEYISECEKKCLYTTGIISSKELLTLSTCYTNITGQTGRLLVVYSQIE